MTVREQSRETSTRSVDLFVSLGQGYEHPRNIAATDCPTLYCH